MNTFGAYIEPRDGLGDNPFKLACSFDEPASAAEIAAAWPGGEVPEELVQVWSTSRQSRLFEDVDYGKWGTDEPLARCAAGREVTLDQIG